MKKKKQDEKVNPIIIIGDNHHNTLGVVRSFGVNGVKPFGIIISTSKKTEYVSKSKYWKKVIIVSDENEALLMLKNKFENKEDRPVIIVTSDRMAELLDLHYDDLSSGFILPSFNEEQGRIAALMNKRSQVEFAMGNNIPVIESIIVDLSSGTKEDSVQDLDYPVILKPVASNDGLKTDIVICNGKDDYRKAIDSIVIKGYSRVLVQPYLKGIEEFVLTGAIEPHSSLISFVIVKHIRQWPLKIGTGSFSEFVTSDLVNQFAYGIMQSLANNGYSGPIDIEFFKDEKENFYLNEFNWRVSGRNFVALYTNVHSSFLWYLAVTGHDIDSYRLTYQGNGFSMNDATDIRHVFNGEMSFCEWLKDLKKTKSFSLWYKPDLRPSFARYRQLIKKLFRKKR